MLINCNLIDHFLLYEWTTPLYLKFTGLTSQISEIIEVLQSVLPNCIQKIEITKHFGTEQEVKIEIINAVQNQKNIIRLIKNVVEDYEDIKLNIIKRKIMNNCAKDAVSSIYSFSITFFLWITFLCQYIYDYIIIKVIAMIIALMFLMISLLYIEKISQLVTQEVYLDMQKSVMARKLLINSLIITLLYTIELTSFLIIRKIKNIFNYENKN